MAKLQIWVMPRLNINLVKFFWKKEKDIYRKAGNKGMLMQVNLSKRI